MSNYLFKALRITASLLLVSPVSSAEEKPYTITDGKVDIYTHVGWKVFNMNCYSCHGVDAIGTDIAPKSGRVTERHEQKMNSFPKF